jgi:hypothetical protein
LDASEDLEEPASLSGPYVLGDRGIRLVQWFTLGVMVLLALFVLVAILDACGQNPDACIGP